MLFPEGRYDLLILNGEIAVPSLIKGLAKRAECILCADGGARHAVRHRLKPDFIIGDGDSFRRPFPGAQIILDVDPHSSDFEKSLRFALSRGCKKLVVAGVFGGRLDHCLVNLALVQRYGRRLEITVADQGLARLMGPGSYSLPFKRHTLFSLLAAPRARLTLTGARYILRREHLAAGSRGLSNRALGAVRLTVHSGRLWVAIGKPA